MQSIKSLIKSVLRRFNIGITTFDALQDLLRNVSDGQRAKEDLEFLAQLPDDKVGQVLGLLSDSKSQLAIGNCWAIARALASTCC